MEHPQPHDHPRTHPDHPAADQVRDPVCGMWVSPATAKGGQVRYQDIAD